jgi:hypothetical protein
LGQDSHERAMMSTPSWVMTYDSLNSTVLQYLERQDQAVVNAIPTFITLCEFEIAQQTNPSLVFDKLKSIQSKSNEFFKLSQNEFNLRVNTKMITIPTFN